MPEDIAEKAAHLLMEEIFRGGCADSLTQSLTTSLMALSPADVSKVVVGPLSPYTIQQLRHMKEFMQIMFKLETYHSEEEHEGGSDGDGLRIGADKVLLTCVGLGFTNLSKKTS